MLVMYVSPSGPMCLRCLMLILSGHEELFLLCFIASWICVVVSVVVVVCSLCIFLSKCPFVLFVFFMTVLMTCLLNKFVIFVGDVIVFLLTNPCIVFHRVCLLYL